MENCGKITRKGTSCKRPVNTGSSTCGIHDNSKALTSFSMGNPTTLSPNPTIDSDDLFEDDKKYCLTCGDVIDLDGKYGECSLCSEAFSLANSHRFNPAPFCAKCSGLCEMDEWR